MHLNRILLVSAPLDNESERREAVNSHCFPPLGLLKIATNFQNEFPQTEIRVVDGDLIGLSAARSIIDSYRPDVVGISVLTPSYKSAVALAAHSRHCGVGYVVFGNDHASFFPELILRRHEEVSFIVSGDAGERDFIDLVKAIADDTNPFDTVSNLHALVDGKYFSTSQLTNRLVTKSEMPTWADPTFMNGSLRRYQESYDSKFGKFHATSRKPFLVNYAKGCYKANDRCFYCSINDLRVQRNDPEAFWSSIQKYWTDYGFNFFFEVCDNFTGLRSYRRELVATIPQWFADSDVELMVYGDANTISRDPSVLDDFEKLHIKRINMGIDSGDSKMLKRLKGFADAQVNYKAIEMLSRRGIQIHGSFVLGGPGENQRSLANTLRLINEAIAETAFVAIEVSPLFPLPKAPVWNLFLGAAMTDQAKAEIEEIAADLDRRPSEFETVWKETRANFSENDEIDLSLASQLWADWFTSIGSESLQSLVTDLNDRISDAGKVTGGFG